MELIKLGNRPLGAVHRSSSRLFGPRTYPVGLPIWGIRDKPKTRETLRRHGATEKEIEFLVSSSGLPSRRVELNALPSDQFIALIERKLDEHGITKIVPDHKTLADAYRRMQRQAIVQDEIDDLMISLGLDEDGVVVPEDLQGQIQAALDRDRTISWDKALRRIVQDRDL